MKLTSTAPWFGGKRTMAPRIVEALGEHRVYWEPFCGSMAVLLGKPRAGFESVNDLHRDLVNLAMVVQHPGMSVDLYGRAARAFMHEDLMRVALAKLTAPTDFEMPDAERAFWYLLFSWQGLNGVAGTQLYNGHSVAARYTANGGHPAIRWRSAVESIPYWHERLFGVQILCRDGFDVIGRIGDADGTVLYVDPPYLKKGASYVHDFTAEDHGRLAELLSRFRKARVVLSYYEDPRLRELYPCWRKVDCATEKKMVRGAMKEPGKVEAPEVLLINGPSVTTGTLFGG